MCANFLCESYLLWQSKIESRSKVFIVKCLNLCNVCQNTFKINHNVCTDCILRSVALADPCGVNKCIVYAYHMCVWFATQVLGNLVPQGPILLTILFFLKKEKNDNYLH